MPPRAATLRPAVEPWCELELAVPPAAGRALLRRLAGGRPRRTRVRVAWHDSFEGTLAEEGLALEERQDGRVRCWRLVRIRPAEGGSWLPSQPAPTLAEAPRPEELGRPLPSPIAARAWLEGARLLAEAGAVRVALLDARLRDADGERARAWLTLSGPADAVTALADELAGAAPVRVPCAVPAAEALAGTAGPRPRGAGAPVLPVALGVGTAFAEVVGQLTASLLAEAPAIPAAMGVDSEPVHRMRVALRRLRAVMSLFGHAVACPALAEARLALKALAAALGPARDWDVFLAGTGRQVGAAFGGEPAVARLLAAAGRQRHAAYAALGAELENAEFRRLGVALACLAAARPWERTAPTDPDAAARRDRLLAQPLEAFAARTLRRRARHLREIGPDLSGLPDAALHAIRLQAKRLRYACEVFAPLYPGRRARRMIRRLAALQDRLGLLNDASVAAGLMASLGAAGHGHAAGIVRGYVAGAAAGARTDAQRAWRRLHRLEPFWE